MKKFTFQPRLFEVQKCLQADGVICDVLVAKNVCGVNRVIRALDNPNK